MIFTWPVYLEVDELKDISSPYFSDLFMIDWSLCIAKSLIKSGDYKHSDFIFLFDFSEL